MWRPVSELLEGGAPLPLVAVRAIVRRALEEDIPWGDLTTTSLVPSTARLAGRFLVKESGVICGLEVASLVFAELDEGVRFTACRHDGDQVAAGKVVAEVRGPARAILTGERTALNLLQRMSGIASETARYVAAVAGTGASIVDTRKTAPGLRVLDKYAVRCGGGSNHRFSLSDGVLVKDNHLAVMAGASGDIAAGLRAARSLAPHTSRIEVEVDRLDQIAAALDGGADIILLDNMPPEVLREAITLIGGRALTEASGGITLAGVRAIADAGVDLISIGALTHSVRALDISLDVTP